MKKLIFLPLFALSCGQNRQAKFPIGIFGIENAPAARAAKAAHFNAIQSYSKDPDDLKVLATTAKEENLLFLADPQMLEMEKTTSWPILAWYLFDEPDVGKIPTSQIAVAKERASKTGRLSSLSVGSGNAAKDFASSVDVLMLDWYPVPHKPLSSIANEIEEAQRHLRPGQQLWMILQAFDWREYVKPSPKIITRFPDAAEIRFMTWLSIAMGANGIFYYTYTRPDGTTLGDEPEKWLAVTQTVKELSSMQRIFANGRSLKIPFPVDPQIAAKAWRHGGRTYIVLANRAKAPRPLPQELALPHWRPLFEVRRDIGDLIPKVDGKLFLPEQRAMVFESRN